MENARREHVKQSIARYVQNKLNRREIDELWSYIIQDEYLFDYLVTAANLKLLITNDMKIAKNKSNYMVEIIEYESGSVFYKTILKKNNEDLSVLCLETDDKPLKKKAKHNVFIQLIDGESEVVVGGNIFPQKLGQGIMIPGDNIFTIKAMKSLDFKIVLTRLKNENQPILNGA